MTSSQACITTHGAAVCPCIFGFMHMFSKHLNCMEKSCCPLFVNWIIYICSFLPFPPPAIHSSICPFGCLLLHPFSVIQWAISYVPNTTLGSENSVPETLIILWSKVIHQKWIGRSWNLCNFPDNTEDKIKKLIVASLWIVGLEYF